MQVLKFRLSGRSAFFKKPEVNTYCYFTYGNIHKIALLGIFGSIIGCNGYSDMAKMLKSVPKKQKKQALEKSYPDFYEKLSDLKISIAPIAKTGVISKKIQRFNNTVGYASEEQGGNLIVKQQWLEEPAWHIYLLLDSPAAEAVKEKIISHQCEYYPYLGSNDHFADITDISIEDAALLDEDYFKLNCLAPSNDFAAKEFDEEEQELMDEQGIKVYMTFKYQESLPYQLNPYTNNYILKNFVYTDEFLVRTGKQNIYKLSGGENIVFY